MQNLNQVTLVTIDTVEHALTQLAVETCLRSAKFAEILIFSDKRIPVPRATHIPCDVHNRRDAEQLMWRGPAEHVKTTHYLMMQYDSWIINPDKWTDEFLDYDYVGAPWRHHLPPRVGNGGFSLRSKKLTNALIAGQFAFNQPEDVAICCQHRERLEQEFAIRFAPVDLAARFSAENTLDTTSSWGFHGAFMFRYLLREAYYFHQALSSGYMEREHAAALQSAESYL